MNSSSKLLLFDYDGTIVNSELAILNGIKYALNYFNCSIPTAALISPIRKFKLAEINL